MKPYLEHEKAVRWVDLIKKYLPYNEQEQRDKEVILKCIDSFEDVLSRRNQVAHITSSAFVVNKSIDKVLMVHHNIYNSWSWIGGHADGEEDLLSVAIRETREETGIKDISLMDENICSLDVLPVFGHVKKGKYISSHLHLSIAFLFQGDERERVSIKPDENSDVSWIPISEINKYSNEQHMKKIYDKILLKLKG